MSDTENTIGMGSGPFSGNNSPEQADMLNTISNVIAGNRDSSSLPNGLESVAKEAGIAARDAKTLEDQQNIYKSYISKAGSISDKQSWTNGTLKSFERIANGYRTKK
ncbi:MAG: hypothetical protein H8D80_00230 [Proteobacteria bacterium]|nr:hypothetical protein [Pseudomonadota bacterium]